MAMGASLAPSIQEVEAGQGEPGDEEEHRQHGKQPTGEAGLALMGHAQRALAHVLAILAGAVFLAAVLRAILRIFFGVFLAMGFSFGRG